MFVPRLAAVEDTSRAAIAGLSKSTVAAAGGDTILKNQLNLKPSTALPARDLLPWIALAIQSSPPTSGTRATRYRTNEVSMTSRARAGSLAMCVVFKLRVRPKSSWSQPPADPSVERIGSSCDAMGRLARGR